MSKLKVFILSLLLSISLLAKEELPPAEGYTINFENVGMKELLQFISKIGSLNLIYNESEIDFNITFVSDRPTSLADVRSALIQILRIHGLSLIEEGKNLIIHKNSAIKQIPTVVSAENPVKGQMPSIMTRVFKIHRGNPTNIAALITPLLSTSAMVEVSIETRQIIVTDVASSIETVHQLLKSLDVPETPYDIDTYEAENMGVLELQIFAQKIMKPLSENMTLEIIAQPDSNTIFIVSTPFLIDKTLALLKEIDNDITYTSGTKRINPTNVLIYPLVYKNEEDIISILKSIFKESKAEGLDVSAIEKIVDNATYISSTHSLLMVGLPENLALIDGFLKNIDIGNTFLGTTNTSFLIYEPQGMNVDEMLKVVDEIAENLQRSGYINQNLLYVLKKATPIYDINSILFVVPQDTRPELMSLLESIIGSYNADIDKTGISHFYLYNIQRATEEQMGDALCNLQEYLKSNEYPNENLIKAISSVKWIKATNSLFFVGTTKSLREVAEILPTFDVATSVSKEFLTQAPPATEFLVFTPNNTDADHLKSLVLETSKNLASSDLSDPAFMKCLDSIKVLKESEQLLFTGTSTALARLNILLEKLDMQSHGGLDETTVFIYEPNSLSFLELQVILQGIVNDSKKLTRPGYSPLFKTIASMRQIKNSESIQFVGTPDSIKKLQEILAKVDKESEIKSAFGSNVLVYKIKDTSPNELIAQLKSIAEESRKQQKKTSALYYAIESVRYVKNTNSLVFVGSTEALQKLQKLLLELDAGETLTNVSPNEKRHVEGYQIYVPQYVSGPELIQMVTSFESHLVHSGMTNGPLAEVVDHLSYVQKTNTIIVSGEKEGVMEVIALLKQFDNLETLGINGDQNLLDASNDQGFLLYKIQNIQGDGIVSALKKISISLGSQQKNSKTNQDLIQAISSIQWIETTNSLIATGTPAVLTKLDQLLKSIDRPIAQVFIEVLVIDTTLDDETTFGLSWQNKGTLKNKFGYSLGNFEPQSDSPGIPFAQDLNKVDGGKTPTGMAIPPLAGGYMGIIGDIIFHNGQSYSSIGSLLNALKSDGNTTIVLSQRIVTQDNQNAKIFSGENVPFTGSLVTTSGLSQTTNANLEYRNIGVTLSITPNISSDGMITLDVDEDISEEINDGSSDGSTSVDSRTINGIRTAKTSMTTKIRVPDRHFVLLSGTMSNSITRNVSGIPCLGGLPLIGAAFSKTEKSINNRNVIMFIKPHVIHNSQEHTEITRNQEALYSREDQCNIQDFSEALDSVKSSSDYNEYDDYDSYDD